ncbi:hypothetical protein VspSTUT11_29890 [Vibrio sp. STUT-A11]|nr:hypothetical protein VspSTUT11_29890 [Vibrio sp. STUT-A11]
MAGKSKTNDKGGDNSFHGCVQFKACLFLKINTITTVLSEYVLYIDVKIPDMAIGDGIK